MKEITQEFKKALAHEKNILADVIIENILNFEKKTDVIITKISMCRTETEDYKGKEITIITINLKTELI